MEKIVENLNEELNNEVLELTKAEKKEIKKEVKEILKEKEKKISSPIKTQLSKEEKIVIFFDHIEFLSL
jgi:vacuolar-type H+-ATPase subunit H